MKILFPLLLHCRNRVSKHVGLAFVIIGDYFFYMKKNHIYYLKNPRLLGCSRPKNSEVIIDTFVGKLVCGHFLYDEDITFNCMKHEFSKIFSSKKI